MAEIVNLRQARKAKKRDAHERTAAENRAKYGRTKAEKLEEKTTSEQAKRHIDQHRLTEDDES